MREKVLFVDDDQKILNGISRQFEDILEFETAASPEDALELFPQEGPFAVVVSDMRMPGMNGIELLSRIKELAADTVRIMLTGYADVQATIDAVNQGNIFRFLSKPCPHEVLSKAVADGISQYRLVTAERELLEGTLHGSIKVLSEILSLVNPLAFGRTNRVQRIALHIGAELQIPYQWNLQIASMLFPLGCVTVSETALECALMGKPIPKREQPALAEHASIARSMLEKIPRLESVAEIVAYQDKCYDGSGNPQDDVCGEDIPIGARVLKVASDFELAYKQSDNTSLAIQMMREHVERYDPLVIKALESALRNGLCQSSRRGVSIQQLSVGMVLASDVRSTTGQLMVTSGQEITDMVRDRLRDLCETGVIANDFLVEMLGKVESSELATL